MTPYTSELASELGPQALERLCRYARVDTRSDPAHEQSPSTPGQLELARLLADELAELGIDEAKIDENGFLTATLTANTEGSATVGYLAHMDTSPDESGTGVEPIVHQNYDGGPIELPREGTMLDPESMPELKGKVGHDIVTASGDTLLGADDKAGVAEIMTAIAHLVSNPQLPRPNLRIGFTIDEEIGQGGGLFDVDNFAADCAYTFDGSERGEFSDETFSAVSATVKVTGVEVHPGQAFGKMINAGAVAARIIAALPPELTPEATRRREGFIHVHAVSGAPGEATIEAIVRDFDDDLLDQHVEILRRAAEENAGAASVEVSVTTQYPNMRSYLDPHPEVSRYALEAIRREGIEPVLLATRGGTDGSLLSARGLPTPNIFAGGHELHSRREWVSVQDMGAASAVAVHLAALWARR